LTYTEYPIKILDTLTRVTRNKVITMCKVQWSHIGEGEATWKREEELRIDFLHYSLVFPKSRGRDFLRGVGFVIPTLLENLKGEIIFLYVHVCHLYLSFHANTS
jgi:hypothetical protein